MADLNSRVPVGSMFLLYANDINDRGEIVGEAFDPSTNVAPAFLAIPNPGVAGASAQASGHETQKIALPESVLKQVQRRMGPVGMDLIGP
jgi:hypothetical protein